MNNKNKKLNKPNWFWFKERILIINIPYLAKSMIKILQHFGSMAWIFWPMVTETITKKRLPKSSED